MKSVNFWPDATAQATLLRRERQQAVLLRLSRLALEGSLSLDDLLNQTVQLVAECLGVDYCKIMEVLPGRDLLQVRAGVGWRPGIVGVATVSASRESQAGMTLEHDGPTVIDDLTTDWRISGPPLLIEHEIRSGVSCVIRGRDGNAWGVIGAHTKKRRNFEADEADFLQSIADTLAALFQRHTAEANARWQERQYRTVVNALPMLIAYITPDHVYRYANATYEAWLGLSPEDVVGRTLPDVLGEKSWEVSRKPVERALAGAPQTYDNTMIGPDGSVRAVQVNLVPDAADDGHCHGEHQSNTYLVHT
ncbi:MAG: PAS domain-containing protein, partial [Planctomycetota bacterium]